MPPLLDSADSVAASWLKRFSNLLQPVSTDVDDNVAALFIPDGYLRDSLVLSWDNRTLHGHEEIQHYLESGLSPSSTRGDERSWTSAVPHHDSFRVVSSSESGSEDVKRFVAAKGDLEGLGVRVGPVSPESAHGIEFGFTFGASIPAGYARNLGVENPPDFVGRGYARLVKPSTRSDSEEQVNGREDYEQTSWKAMTVFISIVDIVGWEETGPELGTYEGHSVAWGDIAAKRRADDEANPEVIIIGAGHCGLNLAATLKQMRIRTLVVENNERVGDNWRKLYPTLALHTTRSFCSFKYVPYPENWPLFAPRDTLADFMEFYAKTNELTVWTRTRFQNASYNSSTGRWTATISRSGAISSSSSMPDASESKLFQLHPKHIVIASGFAHKPVVPDLPGKDQFTGRVMHACMYKGAEMFRGVGSVVVVGAGNTAADICQDLYETLSKPSSASVANGTQFQPPSVTMIQRSSTCVIDRATITAKLQRAWPDTSSPSIYVHDFKAQALPFNLLKKWEIASEAMAWEHNREMFDGLRKAGFQLNMGDQGGGQLVMVFERGGGYAIDVGCAALISSGKIGVKQGSEVASFTQSGVSFKDGSHLLADAVIFATGYEDSRSTLRDLFGADVSERVCAKVYGVDSEGEGKGTYRLTGHPGLWFAMGDFMKARSTSKQLALMIRAIDLGLMKERDKMT